MIDYNVSESIIRDINSPSLLYIFTKSNNGFIIDKKTNSLLACETEMIANGIKAIYPILTSCDIQEWEFQSISDIAEKLCNGNITIVGNEAVDKHFSK